MNPYNLSYQITTVNWDGQLVRRLPDEAFLPNMLAIKNAGVNELMLSGYVTVEEADFDMAEETKRMGAFLDSYGMRPAQHHGLSAVYAPLDRSQEPVIEKLIQGIQWTANLNSPVLVIHPCHFYAPESWTTVSQIDMFESQAAIYGEDAIVETAAKNLHEAAREAERLGVKVALENVDRFEPMGNFKHLSRLIELADSPNVGFCLDSGHAHCCGETTPMEWIRAMGEKLFTTHFHDNRGNRFRSNDGKKWISPGNGLDEHMPPGFGTIPWIDVIQALWEINYTNTVNFESGSWPLENGYHYAISYWRAMEIMAEKKLKK